MNRITYTTEERINDMYERNHKYGAPLKELLTQIKGLGDSGYMVTLKQLKDRYGMEFENNDIQVRIDGCTRILFAADYRGMALKFSDFFSATFCCNLSYVNITDFNKFVKCLNNLPNDGWDF